MSEKEILLLRPHHSLCLQNFVGKGYSEGFALSMARVKKLLEEDPDRVVELTESPDCVCESCPHRTEKGCSSDKPAVFDKNVLSLTGLSIGERLAYKELLALAEPLNAGSLEKCCPSCQWLPLCLSLRGKDIT